MTASEVLYRYFFADQIPLNGESEILKAMEEYSKQEAIAFAEHCSKKDWVYYPQHKKWFHVEGDDLGTSEQLYSEFKSQK